MRLVRLPVVLGARLLERLPERLTGLRCRGSPRLEVLRPLAGPPLVPMVQGARPREGRVERRRGPPLLVLLRAVLPLPLELLELPLPREVQPRAGQPREGRPEHRLRGSTTGRLRQGLLELEPELKPVLLELELEQVLLRERLLEDRRRRYRDS